MAARRSQRDWLAMTDHKLDIVLFGANCSSGRACTTVKERWSESWEGCPTQGNMAYRAGLNFVLPVGRWRGRLPPRMICDQT
jgi:hypothetical protein